MTKSICIATYNGSKYISSQLDSIIEQIEENDEVIIVDDCSQDDTVEIIESYQDKRIRIYKTPKNIRHVKSFEKAISLAKNNLVFLSDQDDVWERNRLKIFEDNFVKYPDIQLITSNFHCIDMDGNIVENPLKKVLARDSCQYKKNMFSIIIGNIGYFGCAMAFRKELVSTVLPIPEYVEAHDLWIAMAGNLLKANLHIADRTLYHRIHQNNASNLNRKLHKKIQARIGLYKQYMELSKRIR